MKAVKLTAGDIDVMSGFIDLAAQGATLVGSQAAALLRRIVIAIGRIGGRRMALIVVTLINQRFFLHFLVRCTLELRFPVLRRMAFPEREKACAKATGLGKRNPACRLQQQKENKF
ncbi:MAG: hypothetical protein V4488_15005 [Pseudomonadota bacterium]